MSDIEDILTLKFIEAVENWKKKTLKNRYKVYLTVADFEFYKKFSFMRDFFFSSFRINKNKRAMSCEY